MKKINIFAIAWLLIITTSLSWMFIVHIKHKKNDVVSRANPASSTANYPTYYESDGLGAGGAWPEIAAGDQLNPIWGNRVRNSILAIEGELGYNPSAGFSTVAAYLLDLSGKLSPNFTIPNNGNLVVTGTGMVQGTRSLLFLGVDAQQYIAANSWFNLIVTPYGQGQYSDTGYQMIRAGSVTGIAGRWDINTAGSGTWVLSIWSGAHNWQTNINANLGQNILGATTYTRGVHPFFANDNIRLLVYNTNGRGNMYFDDMQFTIEVTFND